MRSERELSLRRHRRPTRTAKYIILVHTVCSATDRRGYVSGQIKKPIQPYHNKDPSNMKEAN